MRNDRNRVIALGLCHSIDVCGNPTCRLRPFGDVGVPRVLRLLRPLLYVHAALFQDEDRSRPGRDSDL